MSRGRSLDRLKAVQVLPWPRLDVLMPRLGLNVKLRYDISIHNFHPFIRDLGVFVDSNLTFHSHIDKIVARAFLRSNLILKCFVSRDVSTLMRAFTDYVRPILEYASCVWSPYQMGQLKQIESVQRSFTRRLLYHTCIDYKTRLIRLGVDSIEIR